MLNKPVEQVLAVLCELHRLRQSTLRTFQVYINAHESHLAVPNRSSIASVFKDSVWTIIEPNAGVISACLPYLANILGQKFLNFLKLLSSFASRTSSILLLRSRTNRSTTEDSHSIKMRLSGAAAEAYKLDSDHSHPIPKFNDVSISEASLNHPV